MLKRKIEKYLGQWKEAADRKPLVIKGIRQCGKTYIVRKFATENYESVVYINFISVSRQYRCRHHHPQPVRLDSRFTFHQWENMHHP